MAGVTSEGFVPKTLDELLADVDAPIKAFVGESAALHAQARLGQIRGIVSERYADLWEALEALEASFDPDQAEGTALDALCALTGTVRKAATKSTVTGTATGNNGTVLPSGRTVSVAEIGTKFVTLAGATLVSLTPWAPYTAVVGDRRSNASRSYICITAGATAGAGGPTTTAADITDGSAHWRYIGEGTAAIDVACEAQETGPKTAVSGTLTVIETPVGGWSSFINLLDAKLGTDLETDAALRLRREQEIRASGTSSLEALKAKVRQVTDVTAVDGFENKTDVTDADGVPPHAVEMLVTGGTDQAVLDAVFANKSGGIATHGTTSGTVTDSQGTNHTTKFSRPTEVLAYVRVDVVKDPEKYPTDGDAQIKAKIATYGNSLGSKYDIVSSRLGAQSFGVSGVLELSLTYVSKFPTTTPVSSATIPVSAREIAKFDTSRVTVNSSNGTP